MLLLASAVALVTFACLLPLRLRVDLHRSQRTLIRLQLRYALLEREWRMELLRTPQGRQLIISGRGGRSRQAAMSDLSGDPFDRLLRRLRTEPVPRRFLMRHLRIEQLDAQLLLHLESAANTALLTGAVRTLAALLPLRWREHARLSIRPDFLHDASALNARCIFHIRPGTLILTLGLLLAAMLARQARKAREALSKWNTLSES